MVTGGFALDASVTAAWFFRDEASDLSTALMEALRASRAVVPGLWHYETANLLMQAERRRRITEKECAGAIELLAQLPIETDSESARRAHGHLLTLARAHGVTPYDAAYLDVAIRHCLPLATRDRDLERAARACQVELIDT